MMPDRAIPPRWRWVLRLVRGLLYVTVAGFGVSSIVFTPRTIAGTVGEPLTYWWASLAILGSVICVIGVVSNRYRVEWIGTWPAAGASFMYALTVWGFVINEEYTRLAQSFVALGLFVTLSYRGLELAAHAAELRAYHRGRA